MKFPLQIQFKDIEKSDFVYNNIWDHAEKLEEFFDRIISCHVIVSAPHQHHHQGMIYHIKIHLCVPGGDIVVATEPEKNGAHEDVYVAIRDAFFAVRRRLEDYIRKRRGLVKEKNLPAHGKIVRLFPIEGYGFIVTPDNRELYFHENAVLDGAFGILEVGDEVRFNEELGEKGPQVTSMSKVGSSGHSLLKL